MLIGSPTGDYVEMPQIDWIETLAKHECPLTADQQEQLFQYCFLLRKWSTFTSLVSSGNLEHLEDYHVVDSLSLVPVVQQLVPAGGTLLDIGSGGGFPAIPLAVVLRDRNFVLIERSAKKVSFLRKVMGALKLNHVSLIHGTFPGVCPEEAPEAITARAVERSDHILAEILDVLPETSTFLCQSGDPSDKLDLETFHVEHWNDAWTQSGARRGSLYTISPKSNPQPE